MTEKLSKNGKRIGRPPIYTKEEREVRDLEKRRERGRKWLSKISPEQKQRRKEADERYKKKRVITPELREKMRGYQKASRERKRVTSTPDQLEEMRKKKAAYNASYVLSPEQKARMSERSKKWSAENKDRKDALRAAWAENNPMAYRTYASNRRARKLEQGGSVSPDIAIRLMALQKERCACCKESIKAGFEIDHVVPLAKGGEHDDMNLQLLCKRCNRVKGTTDPIKFAQSRGLLI